MTPEKLLESRRNEWQALSQLLDRGQRSVRRLSPAEVTTLSRLYRAAASDLALAQRDFPDHEVTRYLNQLVARGHALVYQDEPLAIDRLKRFVTTGFPQTFRETLPFFIGAALLFIVPGLLVGLVTGWNPQASRWLLPPQVQELVPLIEERELWVEIPVAERPYTSAFIMRNNIQVTFLAFGGGMLLGLLTLYIMVLNGMLIGGLTGLTAHYGVGFELWTFVIGHGVIELSVIFMAGGAGLLLGWSILRPGLLRRRDSLRMAARSAVRLIVGAVPLLVIAGAIEGFISPNELIPWPVKWAVGLGSGLLLYAYLFLSGRGGN
ncbi:MAG TPA: stage II sporulation protein M [Candidatus Sulfomarinibacteraceae bacterium]|nr:stage II sporulation protein M [Candidatus Sulfomarinibacteraceae bacterium]